MLSLSVPLANDERAVDCAGMHVSPGLLGIHVRAQLGGGAGPGLGTIVH